MATKQTRHLLYFAAVWCLTNKWWSWPAWFSFRCEPPDKSNQSSLRERKTTVPEWGPLPTIYKLLTSVTSFWLFLFSQSKAKYHVYTIVYTVTYHTLWFTKTGTGWLLLLLEISIKLDMKPVESITVANEGEGENLVSTARRNAGQRRVASGAGHDMRCSTPNFCHCQTRRCQAHPGLGPFFIQGEPDTSRVTTWRTSWFSNA